MYASLHCSTVNPSIWASSCPPKSDTPTKTDWSRVGDGGGGKAADDCNKVACRVARRGGDGGGGKAAGDCDKATRRVARRDKSKKRAPVVTITMPVLVRLINLEGYVTHASLASLLRLTVRSF